MEIESLRILIKKSAIIDGCLDFHTIVNVNSRYLGRRVYEYKKMIGNNDFEDLYSIMMKYAEHEIRNIVRKHQKEKLKQIKGKK